MTPIDALEHIIDPENFVKNFASMDAFKEWCRMQIINDLKETLKLYEKKEMYSYCTSIQLVIDEKVDIMLSGLGFDV